jgi:hypothetical protein
LLLVWKEKVVIVLSIQFLQKFMILHCTIKWQGTFSTVGLSTEDTIW